MDTFTTTPTESMSPSPTPSMTWTMSPVRGTETPVPGTCGTIVVSAPYPNPVISGQAVRFDLAAPCPLSVTWEVFSTSYRKIYSETVVVSGAQTVAWNLRDLRGKLIANGAYHVRFVVGGKETANYKVLVLR